MNSKLKIAIVGAGIWGENHAKIYQSHPFAEASAICDMNYDKAKELGSKIGIEKIYNDYNEMFRDSGCDAVAIVTPDFAHGDIAVAAANHKKHILIEKPLATTREDVFRIVEAVEANGVRAMVDLHNRWSPPFNAAYQAMERGELGEVYSAYMRLNDIKWVATDMLPWAAKSSILWFLGSHSLDTLRWFFKDEVKRVYCVSREGILKAKNVDTVDEYLTTIEFRNGGIAQMENGWITPNANPCVNDIKFNLLGTEGMIAIDASNHNLIQQYTDNKVIIPDVIVQNTVFGKPKGFAFESIRGFVDCIIDGSEFPVTIYDAANTSLAILSIFESAKTRTPVEVQY
ncbi:putative dehydrogenase [Anaerobacterium chartisolvens]|uniref:Putative dehydrogenase n=1 Tax=Anaerobacterium chartisolvens TaxID=1297424 RepID=A0A369AVV7_9FIRM|nr:Gfo/Idh/MocA family oxidoreductase [Anaerobacterium chartisolvens]RCX13522.1 putative dehydrogenase [Anaerobacterium chartisolvens]